MFLVFKLPLGTVYSINVGYCTRQVAESKTYGTSQLCINYEAMET